MYYAKRTIMVKRNAKNERCFNTKNVNSTRKQNENPILILSSEFSQAKFNVKISGIYSAENPLLCFKYFVQKLFLQV